ncbi:MAG: DsrE/DsrF/DrsH-like family protein [Pseudomonadota bacterium]
MTEAEIQKLVDERVKAELDKRLANFGDARAMTIVASKGTLDMAYPVLILATTAAAMDLDTTIFFTFYGLDIINKRKFANLKVPPIGNPAMPVPVPNIIGMLPGMTAVATSMMKSWMGKVNVPSIPELMDAARESDVKLIGCQMTMDVMGVKHEDLVEGVQVGGAATYIAAATKAQINLFI